ncbi:hypothetical protein Taro_005521 [Colocasia esculenta]|uniref:Uncharacterized protein n=1 Tax=Colocasia esculenta TaxID=4460 RepID=A0A843TNE4_COLES|nr:hypothetical protein [Colocasia esculenta]
MEDEEGLARRGESAEANRIRAGPIRDPHGSAGRPRTGRIGRIRFDPTQFAGSATIRFAPVP